MSKASKKLLSILRFWSPPVIWAAVIFLFSSLPTLKATEIYWQDFIFKKTAHVVEYAILATLLYRALINSSVKKPKAAFWAVAVSVLYAATDEYHQSFTPGREARLRDVVFDTIGAVLAIYAVWNLLPKAPKRLKTLAEKLQLL